VQLNIFGQQDIFHACQHIVECIKTSVTSFKEVFECLQAGKGFLAF
jgi:molybdopterin synthase catalytic subunit